MALMFANSGLCYARRYLVFARLPTAGVTIRWTNRTVLTNPPALVVNSVVAVVPPFVVMMPLPIARNPDIINWSVPISGAMHVIRAIANPDGDIYRVSRRHRYSAERKQNCKKNHQFLIHDPL